MPDRPDLAELERLREEATPGPWRRDDGPEGQWDLVMIGFVRERVYGFEATHDTRQSQKDAALIVAAVNALPFLLAERERLRAERDYWRERACDKWEADDAGQRPEKGSRPMAEGEIRYEPCHVCVVCGAVDDDLPKGSVCPKCGEEGAPDA